MNINEMLEAWDRGDIVNSVELGGFGPGYEQAIQVAAIEFARAGKNMVLTGDEEKDSDEWDRICTETNRKFNKELCGLSGAQYGAASYLAYQWVFNGGDEIRMKYDEDRRILISKHWPMVK